ncbi:MAG: hypothetical protein LBI45_03400 [Bacteroidales bacterium]|jgi:hypothetical protein|nr:hypothetical protein [Bacteroidales bacterium]
MQSTIKRYREIYVEKPSLDKCFFAFSKTQFEQGKAEAGIGEDEKIYQDSCGLYGTKEGLNAVYAFYEAKNKRIAAKCDPQDIYNFEWANHECMITYDDEEAIQIVIDYFGVEMAKTVERRYAQKKIA